MITIKQQSSCERPNDSGVSILIIAVAMVFILGMAGLGIDLASLYVGRNQAQRAADAAALAAAHYVASSCIGPANGQPISQTCQSAAKQQAIAIGDQNLIAGVSPNIQGSDVTFLSTTSPNDVQIQVVAARNAAHSNSMPTFFVKIFGIDQANISAEAVSEVYNPSGGPTETTSQCVKPWLVPNCDWRTPLADATNSPTNPNCVASSGNGNGNGNTSGNTTQYAQFTTTPYPTPADFDPQDSNPVLPEGAPETATPITIKSSDPSQSSGPGEFYPVFLSNDSSASLSCPSCAKETGGGGSSSGALYRENISCCNVTAIHCGPQSVQPITGDMVGPTGQGVDCLIHEQGGSGQDTFSMTPNSAAGTPWTIIGGSNNPYNLAQQIITSSDSIVTVPLYDGHTLCPGNSCPSQVITTVVGYLQLFIEGEKNGNVTAYVMNVIGCPGSGSSSSGGTTGGATSGSVSGSGGTPIAVRLIHE